VATATAEHSLSDVQRDEILATIDHDSYAVLPFQLPASMLERANAYIDRFRERALADDPDQRFLIETNIVESDPVFRELLTYEPALQLSYDVFGPMFHLGQDTWREKSPHPERGHGSIGWHSDGPVGFPEIDGRCPMHTLRFGYFLTDALHDDSGTLEVIRGSHRRPVLRARTSLRYVRLLENNATDYETDHVTVKAKAGTIVCFHNGIWHQAQAGPNGSA
jgi:hypothetical protein